MTKRMNFFDRIISSYKKAQNQLSTAQHNSFVRFVPFCGLEAQPHAYVNHSIATRSAAGSKEEHV